MQKKRSAPTSPLSQANDKLTFSDEEFLAAEEARAKACSELDDFINSGKEF